MRRIILAITMVALLPVAAYPQQNKGPPTVRSDKEKKQDAEIDKAYRDAVKRSGVNQPAVNNDPWQSVRPAGSDNTKR